MLKVTKKDAAGLTLYEISGGGSKELPQCLTDLAGKDFVFQIRVTPFNFTPSHRTFTVSATLDNITPETFKTSEAQFVQVEGGEASASASNKIGVKTMSQIHPLLGAKRVAVNVQKLSQRQPNSAFV